MSKKIDIILTSKPFTAFLYRFIRLYSSSFQMSIENESPWLDHLRSGGRVLLCAWHQQFFGAIRHFQNYRDFKPGLMISKSKDGEIIAGVALRSGWEAIRGSSSRGGSEAMREVINRLEQTRLVAHVVDGPQGPAGVIKNGLVAIAHAADAVIVPFYVSADRGWYLKSWDRFLLPKPFSRVTIRFDDLLRLPPATDEAEFESQRKLVENIMLPHLHRVESV
jgi:lysophospholipid acyltransferase (LPLAT)-like uncharacterized protein